MEEQSRLLTGQMNTAQGHLQNLNANQADLTSQTHEAKAIALKAQRYLETKATELNNIGKQKSNKLCMYGTNMPNLVKAIKQVK